MPVQHGIELSDFAPRHAATNTVLSQCQQHEEQANYAIPQAEWVAWPESLAAQAKFRSSHHVPEIKAQEPKEHRQKYRQTYQVCRVPVHKEPWIALLFVLLHWRNWLCIKWQVRHPS